MATAPKAAQKAAAPEPAAEAAPPKKSKKKLIIILSVVLLLLAGGGGAAWFFLGEDPPAEGEGAEKVKKPVNPKDIKPPVFLVMEPFTVNLQPDGAGEQFLQVAFSMQVTDQQGVDQIKLYLPQIRSRLLLLLSGKKASQISTPEGKKKLAQEIIDTAKQPPVSGLPPFSITDVFFTSFVIQ